MLRICGAKSSRKTAFRPEMTDWLRYRTQMWVVGVEMRANTDPISIINEFGVDLRKIVAGTSCPSTAAGSHRHIGCGSAADEMNLQQIRRLGRSLAP